MVWGHVETWGQGEREGGGTTWRGLPWDLSNLDFSALGCPKLLDGGVQSLGIRGMR